MAFAEVLTHTKTLRKLNIERNDLKINGLVAMFQALAHNHTLSRLQLQQQTTPIATAVETEVDKALDENMTLTKLGIDIRSAQTKRTVNQKLSRNMDRKRAARRKVVGNGMVAKPQMQWWEPLTCFLSRFCIPVVRPADSTSTLDSMVSR